MYHNYEIFNKENLFLRLNGLEMPNPNQKIAKIQNKLEKYHESLSKSEYGEDFKSLVRNFIASPMSYCVDPLKRKKILQNLKRDLNFQHLVESFLDIFNFVDRFVALKDEFLHRVYFAHSELQIINNLHELINQQFHQIKNDNEEACKKNDMCPKLILPKRNLLIYDTSFSNQLLLRIPALLNTLIILQDRILPLIALHQGIDLKLWNVRHTKYKNANKLPELLKIDNRFNSKIRVRMRKYMNSYGWKLRNYRNLDQHQFNIVMRYGIDASGNFVVYLPDNQGEDLFEKVTFEKKRDGINLLQENFHAFHELVEDLMEILHSPPVKHQRGASYPKSPSIDNYNEGECMGLFQCDQFHIAPLYLDNKSNTGGTPSFNILPLKNNTIRYEIN